MIGIFEAAKEVQQFCESRSWGSCFIGGVAVLRWGEPRVTRDVDLTLMVGFGGEERFVSALLGEFVGRLPDAYEFALRSRVLLLQAGNGVGIDVSLGALPFEAMTVGRSTYFEFEEGVRLRTCSAEDLVVMKLFAGRALDLQDAEGVIRRQVGCFDWAHVREQIGPLAELKDEALTWANLERLARLR